MSISTPAARAKIWTAPAPNASWWRAAVSSELFEQVHVLEDETKRFKLKGAHQMMGGMR